MNLSPEALRAHLDVLRKHRHEMAHAPTVDASGSLVPFLRASQVCCALDAALASLEAQLKEAAH